MPSSRSPKATPSRPPDRCSGPARRRESGLVVALLVLALPHPGGRLIAQEMPAPVRAEREAFREWLMSGANSPFAVLVQRHIGTGLTLGPPDADLPLDGLSPARLSEREGVPYLRRDGREQPLPRFRLVPLGSYRLMIAGPPGRSTVTLYGSSLRGPKAPSWYGYDSRFRLEVSLLPPAEPSVRRMLGADGLEVEAGAAGSVRVALGGEVTTLAVYRIPDPTGEEFELEIFFRDLTNGEATYPAGRFVSLQPLGGTRYRLDFNRARNPFCAYSTAFACPLPWRGNSLPVAVEAGERYAGGGLTPP